MDSRGLTVTSLVNNAVFATFGPFHTEDPRRLEREIMVDVGTVVDVSRAFALERRNPPPSVISGRLNRIAAVAGRLASRRRSVLFMQRLTRVNAT
ncbi:hypothetical protein F0L68_17155 [Solihabitans fulvus]|uniref:Uncharacterized protein n=1 Tax=Solihabitans fulvus TaxID=1892852 RepID=A0A5B2XFC2_9PSEU|nr:hypothetical protein [Solihabitans fulvus]KAA2261502.1 hypothetical protein F0L68_17155 [Solihabitans fulvus]